MAEWRWGQVTALQAAQVVARDVRAIDINMGCPLNFSIKGGMGSSLLTKPDTVADIVSTLRRNLPPHVAVTCKIRLLPEESALLELGRRIEAAGADALAIHARYVPDRSNTSAARWALARPLCDALTIPTLANGDVFLPQHAADIHAATGCDGVMISRGAMWNPSIFRGASAALRNAQAGLEAGAEGAAEVAPPLPLYDVARAYVGVSSWTGNFFQNTKYCLLEMFKGHGRITTAPAYQQYFIRGNGTAWAKREAAAGSPAEALATQLPVLREGLAVLAQGTASSKALCEGYRLPKGSGGGGNG